VRVQQGHGRNVGAASPEDPDGSNETVMVAVSLKNLAHKINTKKPVRCVPEEVSTDQKEDAK
jgi:hypothetical protein